MFLGFQSLMQAIGIAPAFHHAAGEFVNNDDLVLPDNVFNIAREKRVRPQGLVHMMHQGHVFRVIHIAFGEQAKLAEQFFHSFAAQFRQAHRALLFVLLKGFLVLHQLLHHLIGAAVKV